jgi:hypothetical protein
MRQLRFFGIIVQVQTIDDLQSYDLPQRRTSSTTCKVQCIVTIPIISYGKWWQL